MVLQFLAAMPDPVGKVVEKRELDRGLVLSRVTGPVGVLGMIFESRPDALVQIAGLAVRSGNALLLKGGSEAHNTNRILTEVISEASSGKATDVERSPRENKEAAPLPTGWIQLLESRDDVREMMGLDGLVDLIIPRGSSEFVSHIMRNSTIPVLGHADGICHVYVDESADMEESLRIVRDSKMQYVAACNSLETLLVHERVAQQLLPFLKSMLEREGCRIRGCARTAEVIDVERADERDWSMEYVEEVLSIRVVDNAAEAVEHINRYGSGHTDAILTREREVAEGFLAAVDSACVFHNCSTRFSDGYVFGLGAEVGISTSRIHARGPVGVEGLLSYRWLLRGTGQVISDYNEGRATFTHREL